MRTWTTEERYRVLHSADEIIGLHEKIVSSEYRQKFHVQPITGLSSDPNGFVYHKGTWHLYYQYCPWGAVHGLKFWYHVTSTDLVHWTNAGIGMWPDTFYDNKGCHSGSAFSAGDDLYLFYTGNHRDENWVRTPYTCAAKLGPDGKPVKLPEPLFGPRPDYSEHQRDPKIVYVPEQKKYFIFIGAQSMDKKGRALIYTSESLLEGWKFAGELKVPGFEDFGGMWECPCIVRISGKDILIFSPQYTKLPGRAESTNHNIYMIGSMDYETLTFTPDDTYHYLDFGFDFYAAQFAANVNDPEMAVLIGWIGLPDNHYPTEEEDWEGSMSVPRELRLANGRLVQSPPAAFGRILKDAVPGDGKLLKTCLVEIRLPEGENPQDSFTLKLFTKEDGSGGMSFAYDAASKTITADKTGMDLRYNQQVGEVLPVPLDDELKKIRILIDSCSAELFLNDGAATFTTHVYPTAGEHFYTLTGPGAAGAIVTIREILPSVKDDFVV